jgi:hypothetical protein
MIRLNMNTIKTAVPEFIDPVFAKTSSKRSFLVIENECAGACFRKNWVYKLGHWTVGEELQLACEVGREGRPQLAAQERGQCGPSDHRVHRVATAAFWRTFSHEGKISPGW